MPAGRLPAPTWRSLAAGAVCGGVALAAAALAYGFLVEPRRVVVERVRVPVAGLAPELAGFTLVQLSDLHCGARRGHGGWTAHLSRAVQIANELRPDLIVVTGDFVDDTRVVPACMALLAELRAPRGVIAVLGNHDYYGAPLRPHAIVDALREIGIVVLRNDVFAVDGRLPLQIVGLDDAYTGHDKLPQALERLPRRHGTRIMLSHFPDVVDRLAPGTIDLVLSGHVHGGQIRLPLLTYVVTRLHAGASYERGRYVVGDTTLYVNRGLSSDVPQIRFLSPPEVTHITLVPAGA